MNTPAAIASYAIAADGYEDGCTRGASKEKGQEMIPGLFYCVDDEISITYSRARGAVAIIEAKRAISIGG